MRRSTPPRAERLGGLQVEREAPRPVARTDDDAVVALGGLDGQDLVLDVGEHPVGRPLERIAEAAAAGVEEEDLTAPLDREPGAEDAEVDLVVRPRRVHDPGAGSVLPARVPPRSEALAVAEAREDRVAVGEVPDLRHARGAAM